MAPLALRDVVAVTGNYELRFSPRGTARKIKNEKASRALGKDHFHRIDSSMTMRRICAQAEWTEVQTVNPDWLTTSRDGCRTSRCVRLSARLAEAAFMSKPTSIGTMTLRSLSPRSSPSLTRSPARTSTAVRSIHHQLLSAAVPDAPVFRCGRDFAAYLGLVPRQHSTGGKPKLGHISKMGNRHLRKLLVVGAHAALYSMKTGRTRTALADWARALLASKPFKLVAVALADKVARIAWAVMARNEAYEPGLRAPTSQATA